MDGWMDGWMGGCKILFEECLHRSKMIWRKIWGYDSTEILPTRVGRGSEFSFEPKII